MSRELDSYNQRVIEAFRANGGVVEPALDLLLLHHVGARSGRERVTPLAYWRVDDTSVAVLASNRGAPKHPDWYHPPARALDRFAGLSLATVRVVEKLRLASGPDTERP
jgi:deazaflavin-dependent oxidoreductase (nitroreductase family)